ncbi:MAG: LysM peptidoglycan-binding domain-containing protein [Mangrovibacterium sp.]
MQRIFLIILCFTLSLQTMRGSSLTTDVTQEIKLSRKEKKELKKKSQENHSIEEAEEEDVQLISPMQISIPEEERNEPKQIGINDIDDNIEGYFDAKFDSLYQSWIIQQTYELSFFKEEGKSATSNVVDFPDSVYIQRLQSIDSYVDLSFNNTVKSVIELYTQRRPHTAESVLGLSTYYFPMIEEILDKYNLPQELKYMAIIESALNASVRSRAGAQGLWQFMYQTGKMYGLQIDTYVDERCDPIKSTDAAARFLKDLYSIYGDWHLAIAAYNCGAGNVNKAIKRAGSKRDYWHVYYYLPKETRGYVPAFIAAAYFMNHYEKHQLSPKMPDFPISTDTVMVYNYINFEQIANVIDVSVDEIRALNPQYRIDIIPARPENAYALCLPIDKINTFIEEEQQVYNYNRETYFPNNEIKTPLGYTASTKVSGKDKLQYTVKGGDVIGAIAGKFKVSVADLKSWNNLRGNMIRVGQKLTVYVPAGSGASMSSKANTQLISSSANQNSQSRGEISSSNGWVYYTVKSGDNLWQIAKNFPGVSAQNIMDVNGMSSNNLKVGQKLKIKRQ